MADIQKLEIDLDLKENLLITATCKQLDNLNLIFNIWNNGTAADLNNYKCRLKALKQDQIPLVQNTDIVISNNIITIVADEQLTTTSGIVKTELQFINKTTGEKKNTFNLNLKVVSSVLEVDRSISKATCTLLEELDKKLDEIEDIGDVLEEAKKVDDSLKTNIASGNTTNTNISKTIELGDAKNIEVESTITNASNKIKEVESSIINANKSKTELDTSKTNVDAKKLELEVATKNAENKKQEVITECVVADSKIQKMQSFGDVTNVVQEISSLKTEVQASRGTKTNLNTRLEEDKTSLLKELNKVSTDLLELTQQIVTTPTANKILKLDSNSKLPASITGDAYSVGGVQGNQIPLQTLSDITYYVNASSGLDVNNGLSSDSAFKTITCAINKIPRIINNVIIINVASGTYNEDINIRGYVGCGYIAINGDNCVSTTRTVNSVNLSNNSIQVLITGFNVISTVWAITSNSCLNVNINYCQSIVSGAIGFWCNKSIVLVSSSIFSNKSISGIYVTDCSHAFSNTNSGSGNASGLISTNASILGKESTQPSGTTSETTSSGGVIR